MENTTSTKIKRLIFETYIAAIKNSIGTNLFRNFYVKINGDKKDIMKNGELSCAFFVSSIMVMFRLIKEVHGTVESTIKDLEKSGWQQIKKPKIGSILIWEKLYFDGEFHRHIGFFIGGNKAVSNSFEAGCPVKHSWNFNGKRKVDLIFWKKNL